MTFTGFGSQALPFFKALAFHQSKEWFEANRGIYESDVRGPFGDLVETVASKLAEAGLPLTGDRKSSLFRLNRDVRFSKNKNPYKTATGALLTRSGRKTDPGLLYIHIDPEGCFVAAGFYRPEPEQLGRLRRAIASDTRTYARLLQALRKAELELSEGESLSRLPRGFENVTDPVATEGVKRRTFTCSRPVTAVRIAEAALAEDIVDFARAALPLLDWGWAALA